MGNSLLDVEAVRRYLSGRVLVEMETREALVALTFDDGPHPRYTPRLLDLLSERGIPATFFLVGRRVRAFPALVRRMVAEGHEVASHGDFHIPITVLPAPLLRRELRAAARAITEAAGTAPRYFRPPMGWINDAALRTVRTLGYRPVIGSIHPRDFTRPGVERIVAHVTARVRPGSVIILHDGGARLGVDRTQTVAAAGRLIDELSGRGYRFRTLSGPAERPA